MPSDAQADVLFNNMLYRPKDRDTGELREDASPSLGRLIVMMGILNVRFMIWKRFTLS